MLWVLLIAALTLCHAQPSAVGVYMSEAVIASVSANVSAQIVQYIDALHPPPENPNSNVQLSNFNFAVLLQSFGFGVNTGWQYVEQSISFNYDVSSGIISESGTIYIFTTNQNHKSLTVDASINFELSPPSISVASCTYNVEGGDMFIVGQCSSTICLIPVGDIIGPIAQNFIPSLQNAVVSQVQERGSAFLGKVTDIFRVPIGVNGHYLVLNGMGQLQAQPDGSLIYMASGASLVQEGGSTQQPPVSNSVPVPAQAPWASSSEFQVALSPYFFSSFGWALATLGELDGVIAHAPASSPIQLNTNNIFFRNAIPGLTKYPNLNLTLTLTSTTNWPQTSISSSGIAVGPLTWTMGVSIVNGTNVVIANAVTLNVNVSLLLNATASAVSSTHASVLLQILSHQGNVTLIQSNIGTINVNAFNVMLTFAFALAKIPPVTLPVPSELALQSVSIELIPSLMVVSLNAQLNPPLPRRSVNMPTHVSSSKKSAPRRMAAVPTHNRTMSLDAGQLCGAGDIACPDQQTCCYGSSTPYACCPLPHATCCQQIGYCCPNGSGCTSDNPPQCEGF